MRQPCRRAGLDEAVIVNTCAVTAEAVRQARQTIRRRGASGRRADHRDGLRRPDRAGALCRHARGRSRHRQRRENAGARLPGARGLTDSGACRSTTSCRCARPRSPGRRLWLRARAFVQVQNGCDHRCTFCIIPFGRGPSRSVPAGEVVAQVRRLVEAGYLEVVLTGVDITSYGADLPARRRSASWCATILKHVPELERLGCRRSIRSRPRELLALSRRRSVSCRTCICPCSRATT